jgi:hypothetical protein
VDWSLKSELREAVGRHPGARLLAAGESGRIVAAAATAFLTEPAAIWWWAALREPALSCPYHGNGLDTVAALLPKEVRGATLLLIATSELARPAGVIEGRWEVLRQVIEDLSYFEFVLTDAEMQWAVLDTHHNAALRVPAEGSCPTTA